MRSQLGTVKKENLSLAQSVSACSKEMDELVKEISEKQKYFKENHKIIRVQLKEKFLEKYKKLEKEKLLLLSEAETKIDSLTQELYYYQARERETSNYIKKISSRESDHKRCISEINLLESRIAELEHFLEAERSQKAQLMALKNREIEELTLKHNNKSL
jgi:DNA repair exonuclease SbcCD ATPase subunit